MKKDLKKAQKNELKMQAQALRFQVEWKSKTLFPEMNDAIKLRLEEELNWIVSNNLAHGFMQLKELSDAAKDIIGSPIAPDHGSLGDCLVAYCLGITGADPMITNRRMAEMDAPAPQFLNVSIHFDPDKRNDIVAWAEQRHNTKAMTRMGVYIIKLDRIILEFHRNMKGL